MTCKGKQDSDLGHLDENSYGVQRWSFSLPGYLLLSQPWLQQLRHTCRACRPERSQFHVQMRAINQ